MLQSNLFGNQSNILNSGGMNVAASAIASQFNTFNPDELRI